MKFFQSNSLDKLRILEFIKITLSLMDEMNKDDLCYKEYVAELENLVLNENNLKNYEKKF